MMTTPRLKPCPFCGRTKRLSVATVYRLWTEAADGEPRDVTQERVCKFAVLVLEYWNRRPRGRKGRAG